MSGMLAAHALSRRPALEDIVGFDHPFSGGISVDQRPIETFILEPSLDPRR